MLQRVKRKAPRKFFETCLIYFSCLVHRSRRCVQNVVSRLAIDPGCSQKDSTLNLNLLEELDNCYKEDLQQRFRRNNDEQLAVLNSTGKNFGVEGDWEYWSIKDSVLFCFTVVSIEYRKTQSFADLFLLAQKSA
jgi:hypothetical protein